MRFVISCFVIMHGAISLLRMIHSVSLVNIVIYQEDQIARKCHSIQEWMPRKLQTLWVRNMECISRYISVRGVTAGISGKKSRNKYDIDFKKESEKAGFINHPNILYEKLKHLQIADFAPVYGNGVGDRTFSGCGNVKLLHAIRDAGIKVVIDLRTQDHTNRFEQDVVEAGLEYFHIPIDKNGTDVHEIISALPELFNWLDKGYYYMACAMGLHRTDIALALYYVFHPLVDYYDVPEMRA